MGALMVFIGFVDGDGEALFWGFASFFLYSLRHFSPSVNAAENLVGNRIKTDVQRGLAWGTKRRTCDEPTARADVGTRLKA